MVADRTGTGRLPEGDGDGPALQGHAAESDAARSSRAYLDTRSGGDTPQGIDPTRSLERWAWYPGRDV